MTEVLFFTPVRLIVLSMQAFTDAITGLASVRKAVQAAMNPDADGGKGKKGKGKKKK